MYLLISLILGVLIGISLGLIGSGGSILTIPVLVYLMLVPPSDATTYSLFIVGISALIGSIKGIKDKLLDYKMILYFGLPSVLSIFIMRTYFMPLLPPVLLSFSGFVVSKDLFIMLVFSALMLVSSFSMIQKKAIITNELNVINVKSIVFKGILVGILTGFVGVGGGFLVIPTLLFSAKLPMKKAVPTSLFIVAINALIGFSGSVSKTIIDWNFLLEFTSFTTIGIFIGMYLSTIISNEKLKPIFGWFVLITGIYVLVKELILNT